MTSPPSTPSAAPRTLEPLVLDQVRLSAHSDALGEAEGGEVTRVYPSDDPVRAICPERDVKQRAHGLGGEFLPAVVGMKDVADLAAGNARDCAR